MQKDLTLKLKPAEAADDTIIQKTIAQTLAKSLKNINGYYVTKKSIDARAKQPWIQLSVKAFIDEPFIHRPLSPITLKDVSTAQHKVIIIGAGPAGLYAALTCIEKGVQPIILERGKDVRSRRRDLAALNKQGIVNPESNYCFGEGGAGTYSDGKLYTRSNKRGDINRILNILVQYGADEKILFESHPHVGTNKLPQIMTQIREAILSAGGQFLFEQKVVDFNINNQTIQSVITADGHTFTGDAVILATGHSARDIFELLHQKQISIEAKPFALGVRIEHPQTLIDQIQYHCPVRDENLPPAAYSLVQQVNNMGVFSFCMCPGGIIAPASTAPGELVVNGWSPSKRNNPHANSGMVVTIEEKHYHSLIPKFGPLAAMEFQKRVEQKSYAAGGGKMVAPAQRMVDFVNNKVSSSLPSNSYLPGLNSTALKDVLPTFVSEALKGAFKAFDQKMKGYYTNDAILVATESRTSSPVRIPRDAQTLEHPQIKHLYPCGEGAGYAGGIVSAAMDGERVANMIIQKLIPHS